MYKEDYEFIIEMFNQAVAEKSSASFLDTMQAAAEVRPSRPEKSSVVYPTKKNGFYFIEEKEGKNGDVKLIFIPDYDGLASYMKNEVHLLCDDAFTYLYDGVKYVSASGLQVHNIVKDLVMENISPAKLQQFTKAAMIECYINYSEISHPSGLLNCANGVLDVRTGSITKHDPKHFFRYCLAHEYRPEDDCPQFIESLDLVTNGDKDLQKLIQQVFGYCIIGGAPVAQKAFMFYGEGGNGKSTILTALRNLIGVENVSHVPLSLFDKPFSAIRLDGKLANIVDETPKKNINPEAFKNVVTGGYISAANKGKDEFDLQVNARIIFACNSLPNFGDSSDGLRRRLVIIPFSHKIEENIADRDIDFKISSEMSGILNWSLVGLNSLRKNNFNFISPKSVNEAIEEFKVETDSVYDFLSQTLVFMDGPNGSDVFTKTDDAYSLYCIFCKDGNNFPCSKNQFSKRAMAYYRTAFKKNEHTLEEKHRTKTIDGKVFRGIMRVSIIYNGKTQVM